MTQATKRVLIVDDGADSRASLAALLRLIGHEVVEAEDGPTALRLAVEFAPQVVVLDIGLPGMDGFEVAIRLRQIPETATAMVIGLTGFGNPEVGERAKQVWIDHHFVKPLHPKVLERLLST